MLELLQNVFLPKRFFEGTLAERRRSLLIFKLQLMSVCTLILYFFAHPDFDPAANFVGTAGYVILLVSLRLGAPYFVIANASLLWSILFIVYLASLTGGVNSPVMIWMTVIALPAILLLERAWALSWVGVAIAVNFVLLVCSQYGWIDGSTNTSHDAIAWTGVHKSFVMVFAMYVVFMTEQTHRSRVSEMEQNNADLERTHQALIRAQAHKDEFIASVGHELRTPMNAILGLNGILRKELSGNAQDVEVVDHIRRSTEQLLQVVNDILDFSQLQAGRLTLHEEEFAVRETLRHVLAGYESKAREKGLALILETGPVHNMWVRGDQQRLIQVLKNLLDNALKFTSQGRIQVQAQPVDGGVLFEVQDSGIGIAPDKQQQIFKGFEPADAQTNRQYGGTGLGLAICDRLVRLQGGLMGVSSVQGQGARFWFQLPLRPIATREGEAAAEMARSLVNQALRILLVDDNAVNLLVARMMLKKCLPKAEVVEADGGASALQKLQEQPFESYQKAVWFLFH